jgi:hypothetical protein
MAASKDPYVLLARLVQRFRTMQRCHKSTNGDCALSSADDHLDALEKAVADAEAMLRSRPN